MIYDADHNVLVYDALPAEKRLSIFRHADGARSLVNGYLMVPASLRNLQVLRWLELPVIPPMRDYNWPRNHVAIPQPFSSQITRANHLVVHPRDLDLSDPGTGKTITAAWAADWLMHQYRKAGEEFRAIVVCPLSIMRDQWERTINENFMGRRTCVVLHGSAEKRRKLLAEPHDFYIINHDGVGVGARIGKKQLVFTGFAADLLERRDIRLAIIDEISGYRDYSTNRSKVTRRLLGYREYLWGLTGTPTPQGPIDAYGIRRLMDTSYVETHKQYQSRVEIQVSNYKWVPKPEGNEIARKMLSPAIRFSLEDCVPDMPEMLTIDYEAPLSDEQKKAFADFKKNMQAILANGGVIDAANEAVLRLKFLQIACGAVYDGAHVAHQLDCRPRLGVLKEILEDDAGKIIVFAPFTSVLNMLNVTLRDQSRALINGSVNDKERANIFRAFRQERSPRILLADPATMSHGLNLACSHTVVWYGPTDRGEIYQQANRRIRRPDQKHVQRICRIIGQKTEREIYRRLLTNENMQGALLQMLEGRE